ncbi:dTMP kinase [Brevibacillus laterosporus]|uniref:dTMP kinase n=1 Tax=Brevibacillus laterosporus TaxID=1465 RepID=UPI000382C379|nr:dTMP kinase [Brevibacillus laterosporus]ATO48526.1 dTMP kinase [Brevibacillus laterosporus DSM 25]MED2002359.1 dTMP kinase [Brevibacillus laterosporus]
MRLIAVEGIDASGKETQVNKLYLALKNKGYDVAVVGFPRYHTPIGQVLLDYFKGETSLTTEAVHMLLEADRQDFMEDLLLLEETGCEYVILDRFTLSNLAFGVARGVELDWLRGLAEKVRQPDITFILDISAETSFKRKVNRDILEQDADLQNRARVVYQTLARRLSEEEDYLVHVIDANTATPDALHEVLMSHIETLYLGVQYPEVATEE